MPKLATGFKLEVGGETYTTTETLSFTPEKAFPCGTDLPSTFFITPEMDYPDLNQINTTADLSEVCHFTQSKVGIIDSDGYIGTLDLTVKTFIKFLSGKIMLGLSSFKNLEDPIAMFPGEASYDLITAKSKVVLLPTGVSTPKTVESETVETGKIKIRFAPGIQLEINGRRRTTQCDIEVIVKHNFVFDNNLLLVAEEPVTSTNIVDSPLIDCTFLSQPCFFNQGVVTFEMDLNKAKSVKLVQSTSFKVLTESQIIRSSSFKKEQRSCHDSWSYVYASVSAGMEAYKKHYFNLETDKIILGLKEKFGQDYLKRISELCENPLFNPVPRHFKTQKEKDQFMTREIAYFKERLTAFDTAIVDEAN